MLAQWSQLETLLSEIAREHAPAAFANSFGAEDMVLTDAIARSGAPIEIFTLDTGRLPEETHRLIASVEQRYRLKVRTFVPDAAELEHYLRAHGANAFYDSLQLRKQCCHIRKVAPLKRALEGRGAWITGLRREQAATRGGLQACAFDAEHGLQKFNPLLDWTHDDVWNYLRANDVPYNELHDRGYPSIGCAPCTRAVRPGEDVRAGRWWWENPQHKECGLHVAAQKPAAFQPAQAFARAQNLIHDKTHS
jgi:phosphoadenosine phosphosulfate reductase